MDIYKELLSLADHEYAQFQSRLLPNIPPERIIGVRMPEMRSFAKKIKNTSEAEEFLQALPHCSYDENMLHGLLISEKKDFQECLSSLEIFLPFIDNWAVCDCLLPKSFGKHTSELMPCIKSWFSSPEPYICRFGLHILMRHFLDGLFREEYLEIPAGVISDHYYVNMMIAWFYATALAKQWDATIPYIREKRLPLWVNNKTIQKAIESYRISPEQKEYLKRFKRRTSDK